MMPSVSEQHASVGVIPGIGVKLCCVKLSTREHHLTSFIPSEAHWSQGQDSSRGQKFRGNFCLLPNPLPMSLLLSDPACWSGPPALLTRILWWVTAPCSVSSLHPCPQPSSHCGTKSTFSVAHLWPATLRLSPAHTPVPTRSDFRSDSQSDPTSIKRHW